MRKKLPNYLIIICLLIASNSWANEEKDNKEQNIDIDKEVINPRLRAISGSKSKWSLTFTLDYNGGTLVNPFGQVRPDIYGNPENETLTSLSGSFSGRYRFDEKNSVLLGIGMAWLSPLRDDNDPANGQFSMVNPGVGYSRVERIGIFQIVSGADYVHGTSQSYQEQNLTAFFALSTTLLTNFDNSRFNLGLSLSFTNYFYSDDPVSEDKRTSYAIGLFPFFEFEITKVYYFRTVFGYMNYEQLRGEDDQSVTSMNTAPLYQSVGIGIAISRDIYIYPNIQFLPKDMSTANTNFAISATINVL